LSWAALVQQPRRASTRKLKKNAPPDSLSKTRVFERDRPDRNTRTLSGRPQSRRSIDNGRKPGSVGFAVESDAHQCHRHDKAEAVREAPSEEIVILCR